MTETQDTGIVSLARRALEALDSGDLAGTQQLFAQLAAQMPPESPTRQSILGSLSALTFHLTSNSIPPSQVTDRLRTIAISLANSTAAPARLQPRKESSAKRWGPIGVVLAFLAKFKTVGLLLATKGKLLLLGLTNFKVMFAILSFVGIYWTLYGWWFAIGFFLSILVHEMGHFVAARLYGYAAEAPVFIPFFGAFVRWQGASASLETRANVALAGPLAGFAAAIACYGIYRTTGSAVWLSLAHTGAFLNLFNLIPVGFLDGGSVARALGRQERLAVLIVSLSLWFFLSEFLFLLIGLGAAYQLFRRDYPEKPSQAAGYYYVALLVALGLFSWWMLQNSMVAFPQAPRVPGTDGSGSLV